MNKKIIITGASRGIGRELVKIHLQNGNHVLAIARNEQKLNSLKEFQHHSELNCLPLDVEEYDKLDQIADAIADWDRIDVLYNNAGYLVKKPFLNLTEKDVDQSISVNFKAPFRLIQLLVNQMNQNSHIVNISTMGAIQGSTKFSELAIYSSSKSPIITLTELLSQTTEFLPKINSVALGAVQTEILEEAFPGYIAPISAQNAAEFLYHFGLMGHQFQNGKTVQLSLSTP